MKEERINGKMKECEMNRQPTEEMKEKTESKTAQSVILSSEGAKMPQKIQKSVIKCYKPRGKRDV